MIMSGNAAWNRHVFKRWRKIDRDGPDITDCWYMAFLIFKMAAAAILNFQKFEVVTVCHLVGAIMRYRAKFHQNR